MLEVWLKMMQTADIRSSKHTEESYPPHRKFAHHSTNW